MTKIEEIVDKKIEEVFEEFGYNWKSSRNDLNNEEYKKLKRLLSERVQSYLSEDDQEEEEVVEIEIKTRNIQTVDKIVDFIEYVKHLCDVGASRSFVIDNPSTDDESDKKWSFDGDGDEKIFDIKVDKS